MHHRPRARPVPVASWRPRACVAGIAVGAIPSSDARPMARHAAFRPAASSLTASVVTGLPPMPHSPLVTSEIFTQVTPRMFSPSTETMASVNFWMICRFCSGLNTFSIRWTSINGIVVLLYADLAHARTLATLCASRPVKTFSIGFDHNEFDETHYARQVANAFATEHHELILKPDVVGTLEKLTPGLEEPFADSSILPTYYVSKLAREHVTVALSGDGGDELFAGYERYTRLLRRSQLDHLPQWLGRLYREQLFHRTPSFYGRRFLFNISLPLRDRYIDSVSHFPAWGRERELFSKDFLSWSDSVESPLNLFRRYFDEAPAKDFVSQLLYLDTKTYLPFDILTKVDRMSMATSLEVRVPMLDHIFLEWVTSLPVSLKLHHMNGKYILKKLAERVGVPSEVLHRPKRGFAMPLVHWMRQELKRDLVEILLEPRTLERGYYSKIALRRLVEEHTSGRRDRSHELWLLLMLELWHRNFLEARAGTQLQSTAISVLSAT